ncbi:WD40 repeat domain-containing protein [Roseimaritima ulvae]|uniref:Uncharacterized protein n=1 Tax=Roseimaritima ulvae TaxID=980254 RepID=A0A5B9R0Q1_9BACT|nr:hypothetical protein [Roseimaritima ulvae]QEG43315.1 hypothetical protein UC8_53620 [Roseimaritima ulvae]
MKRLLTWLTATPLVMMAAAALLLCCCTAAWLPDSSGFLTISQRGQVVLFDLASGKETEIVAGATTPLVGSVAVSPDSQRIAVVQVVMGQGRASALLSLYSTSGELLHRSEKIPVREEPVQEAPGQKAKEPYPAIAAVSCWSPDGKRILVCLFGNQSTVISYELATQQVERFEDFLPAGMVGVESLPIRAAVPFLPGGEGFLAIRAPKAGGPGGVAPEFRLFRFSPAMPNRSEPFTYTAAARERFAPPAVNADAAPNATADAAADAPSGGRVLLPAYWSQGKLRMARHRGTIVVDPETKQVDYRADAEIETLAAYAERHDVRVVDRLGDDLVVQMNATGRLVEIAERETGKVRSKVQLDNQQGVPITVEVAPNRQFLLVSCAVPKPRYWVFDVTGKPIYQGQVGHTLGRP